MREDLAKLVSGLVTLYGFVVLATHFAALPRMRQLLGALSMSAGTAAAVGLLGMTCMMILSLRDSDRKKWR